MLQILCSSVSVRLLARAKLIFLKEQPDDFFSVGNPDVQHHTSSTITVIGGSKLTVIYETMRMHTHCDMNYQIWITCIIFIVIYDI